MSDTTTTTLRYGFQPSSAFAATRAIAARQAREAAAAATSDDARPDPASHVLPKLSTFFAALIGRRG